MEKSLLLEFIQNTVNEVVHDNKPFDESKKKWLYRYCEMENLDDEKSNAIVNNLELFILTLEELRTNESEYLLVMAKICGHRSTLSEARIEELVEEMTVLRNESIAQMNAEIQENEDVLLEETKRYNKETHLLSELKAAIKQVQNDNEKLIDDADKKAFAKIEQQWNKEQAELERSKNQVKSKEKAITGLNKETEELREKTKKERKYAISLKDKRKRIIHLMLLIALAIFLSLTEFLFIQKKGLAWVAVILNAIFVLPIIIEDSFDNYFGSILGYFFSMVPLVLMAAEVFFIDTFFEWKWLLTFCILIPTLIIYILLTFYITEETPSQEMGVHHLLLATLAIIVSLAEFFTFGYDIFYLFDDGWGWGFISLIVNVGYVGSRVALIEENDYWDSPKKEYLLSLLSFALITTVAYCTHNLWKLLLIPVGVGVFFLTVGIDELINKRS